MTIQEAALAATDWIDRCESQSPGFLGAYVGGSAATLPESAPLPAGSDLDVFAVLDAPPPPKRGKFLHRGALLEISYLAADAIFPPERALADYHLAHSLRFGRLLRDPTGALAALQREVAERFARRDAIALRRDGALNRVHSGLTAPLPEPLPDRTLSWLFPTGIAAHAVLVSALKNPTVRLRYLRAREVLAAEGFPDWSERLLSLAGFADVTRARARALLDALAPLYDRAAARGRTPFPFSSDVSPQCRAVALDDIAARIDVGDHRESMFWILATWARAMKILSADDPEGFALYLPAFHEALAAVHRDSEGEILAARRETLRALPELRAVTDAILRRHATD